MLVTPTEFTLARAERMGRDLRARLLPSTVSLVVLNEVGGFRHWATGVLFATGGVHFMITAAHAWDNFIGADTIMPALGLLHGEAPELVPLTTWRAYSKREKLDVAAVRLDEQAVADLLRHGCRFINRAELEADHRESSDCSYVVLGFPIEWASKPGVAPQLLPWLTGVARADRSPLPGEDSRVDLMLDLQATGLATDGAELTIPHFKGVSGGGVWFVRRRGEHLLDWHVDDLRLVGLEVACTDEAIRTTRIGFALAVIADAEPDLRRGLELSSVRRRTFDGWKTIHARWRGRSRRP